MMIRLCAALLAALISGAAMPAQSARAQQGSVPASRIDWAAFLARHDLVWDRLPMRWGESAFIGNGRLGATIDVQDGTLGWTINRTDVVHDQSRYPIGRVLVKTSGAIRSGTARLTLWDAEASGTLVTDRGEVRWRSFTAAAPSAIVIVLEGRDGEREVDLDWSPAEARPPRKVARKEPFAAEDLHPPPTVTRVPAGITSVQTFINGGAHAESIRRTGSFGRGKVFYVSIGRGSSGADAIAEAQTLTSEATRLGLARLLAAHRNWWHAYYPACFLTFPDERLEGYYWIQMYKLGSAMRPDGPILDLAGPWYRNTPWPAIWWNLNIQLTYSPLFRANRLGLAESLFRNLDRNRQALIENVPERFRGEAAAIGRSSGPDLVRRVDLATAQSDAAREMGNLPWTMYYYWLHYRYQMDDRILRGRVYPLLKRAIGNYLAYVEKGTDGHWHLPPTHSPELATVPDANYDLALLRWGLRTLIMSAERLRIDEPLLPRWRDVLANLTQFPTDSAGLMVGAGRPWKESHRHYSHLLAIYPLALITADSVSGRGLIEQSLRTWEREPSLFRGYSFTGGASMHELLGHGDIALTRLNQFLDAPRYMEPNTFYAEAGPVIETPLSAATSIQELFLQDWGGTLRVFPAMPSAWTDAAFEHLRADGAFLVSAVRRNGRTSWVRIESLAGQPCRLLVADWEAAVVRSRTGAGAGAAPRITRQASGELLIELAKGASVVLAPDSATPLPNVSPVALPPSRRPAWPALKQDTTRTRPDTSTGPIARPRLARGRWSMEPRGAPIDYSSSFHRQIDRTVSVTDDGRVASSGRSTSCSRREFVATALVGPALAAGAVENTVVRRLGRIAAGSQETVRIESPNRAVAFHLLAGSRPRLSYVVTLANQPVIETSPLSTLVDGVDLAQGAEAGRVETYDRNERYEWRGVHAEARDHHRGARVALRHAATKTDFEIEIRVFDAGIAFRWNVPGTGARVPDEASAFTMPSGSTVWYHDLRGHYEGTHTKKDVADVQPGDWAAPPVTFRLPNGRGYASITEAALIAYSGLALQADGERSFRTRLGHAHPASYPFTLRYGEAEATRLAQPASIVGPIVTPWRVVMIAPDLNTLLNCDIVHDLSPAPDRRFFPRGLDTTWVKPGRAVWKYLDGGGENSLETMKEFSRLAGELGFEYNLVEGFWQRWSESELRELVDYSRRQHVGIWLWKHSRDLRTPEQRDAFFTHAQAAGAVGVKLDFFDHEAKEVVELYEAALRGAAEHRLMVDFHGANKPTGESRTWPNELTREAVSGMERRSMPAWSVHDTTIPFTRMLAGHLDFTPMLFGERRRETTWAHQIATAAIFTSPLLVYGAHPRSILEHPAAEMIRSIPSVWDETRVLPFSEIGEIAAFARRRGGQWFLVIANGPVARSVEVPLSFLGGGAHDALLVADQPDEPASVRVDRARLRAKDSLTINLRAGGGFIARFA